MILNKENSLSDRCDGSDRSPPSKAMARPSVIKSTTGKTLNLSASSFESSKPKSACDLYTSDDCSLSDFDLELNDDDFDSIQSLCMNFLVEEAPYMEEKVVLFFNTWGKVNLGEDIMRSYISFSKNRTAIPKAFLGMTGRQFRLVLPFFLSSISNIRFQFPPPNSLKVPMKKPP